MGMLQRPNGQFMQIASTVSDSNSWCIPMFIIWESPNYYMLLLLIFPGQWSLIDGSFQAYIWCILLPYYDDNFCSSVDICSHTQSNHFSWGYFLYIHAHKQAQVYTHTHQINQEKKCSGILRRDITLNQYKICSLIVFKRGPGNRNLLLTNWVATQGTWSLPLASVDVV